MAADDAGARRVEPGRGPDLRQAAGDLRRSGRLQIYAVVSGSPVYLFKLSQLVRACNDPLAGLAITDSPGAAVIIQALAPLQAQSGLEGISRIIDSSVYHFAVTRGYSLPKVTPLLQQDDFLPRQGEFSGNCQPHHTSANHHRIDVQGFQNFVSRLLNCLRRNRYTVAQFP